MKKQGILWTVLAAIGVSACLLAAIAQEETPLNQMSPPEQEFAPPMEEPAAAPPQETFTGWQTGTEEEEISPLPEEQPYEPTETMEDVEEASMPEEIIESMEEAPLMTEEVSDLVVDEAALTPLTTNAMAELIELKPDDEGTMGDRARPDQTKEGLISVTLDNVPLQDVVRMFARISGANIVSGTNLQGNVTVSLKDVEWQPALRTILDTAGMTLVMKSPGIYSVVSKSEAASAPVTIDTIYLQYTTTSNVVPIVQRMLVSSNSSVAAFPSANALIVQETSERLDSIKEMVTRIDKPRPQVFIEAKFVELNDEAIKNLGINWQSLENYTLSANSMTWGVTENREWTSSRVAAQNQTATMRNSDAVNRSYDIDGIPSGTMVGPGGEGTVGRTTTTSSEQSQENTLDISDGFTRTVSDLRAAVLSAADFQVTLSALQQESGVSVVSNPRIIVASGETAKIHVGRKDPNYVTRDEPGPSAGTTITKRELSAELPFIETGVKVDVLPTVNTESNITIRIIPELSRILPGGQAGDIPPISTRTITSEFNLESGRTVAIGGLTSTDDRETVTKVPLLGDIPLIGRYLFRHTHTEKVQDETIIFVTVGMANPESLNTSAGIPTGGRLIHRHLAREATRVEAEEVLPGR